MADWHALALAVAAAAAGTGQGAASAPATAAEVQAAYQRQVALCQQLALAAVRAECLRQAERSRTQALRQLQGRPPGPAPGASG